MSGRLAELAAAHWLSVDEPNCDMGARFSRAHSAHCRRTLSADHADEPDSPDERLLAGPLAEHDRPSSSHATSPTLDQRDMGAQLNGSATGGAGTASGPAAAATRAAKLSLAKLRRMRRRTRTPDAEVTGAQSTLALLGMMGRLTTDVAMTSTVEEEPDETAATDGENTAGGEDQHKPRSTRRSPMPLAFSFGEGGGAGMMHRRSMLVPPRKHSRHISTKTSSILSTEQKLAVQHTWRLCKEQCVEDECLYGHKVFKSVFEQAPDLRRMFKLSPTETLDSVTEVHPFYRHLRIFTNIIDLAVRTVDELEVQLAPALVIFGRRHYCKHNVTFSTIYLNVFADGIISNVEHIVGGEEFNEDANAGWITLVSFIIQKLKHGYDLEYIERGPRVHAGR